MQKTARERVSAFADGVFLVSSSSECVQNFLFLGLIFFLGNQSVIAQALELFKPLLHILRRCRLRLVLRAGCRFWLAVQHKRLPV